MRNDNKNVKLAISLAYYHITLARRFFFKTRGLFDLLAFELFGAVMFGNNTQVFPRLFTVFTQFL